MLVNLQLEAHSQGCATSDQACNLNSSLNIECPHSLRVVVRFSSALAQHSSLRAHGTMLLRLCSYSATWAYSNLGFVFAVGSGGLHDEHIREKSLSDIMVTTYKGVVGG